MNTKRGILFKIAIIATLLALLLIAAADALTRTLEEKREREVLPFVLLYSKTYDLSPALVLAVIKTESDFRSRAVSEVGAVGLMQLMPETFLYLSTEKLKETHHESALFDPDVNLKYGCYYLSYLFERFDDLTAVIAAYNAGEGRVAAWLSNPQLSQNGKLLNIPFGETAAYVKNVNAAFIKYQNKYQFKEQ